MFIHCDVCNMTVKTRTGRPLTFSRWNEHLVCKTHHARETYKTHQAAIKLKADEDNALSKLESAVLRKQIGIHTFSAPKKK